MKKILSILLIQITVLFSFTALAMAQTGVFKGKDAAYWIERLNKKEAEENKQNQTRWYAAYALGEIGPEASGAVDALGERLLDPAEYEYTRAACAWALGRIQNEKAVDILAQALQSKMNAVRISAAQSLGLFGSKGGSAADSLKAILTGKSPEDDSTEKDSSETAPKLIPAVKAACAAALWKISEVNSENATLASTTLLEMLKMNSTQNRIAALSELVVLAKNPQMDFAPFHKTLALLFEKSSNDDIARDCGAILMAKGQNSLIEVLLKNENAFVRRRALRTICQAAEAGKTTQNDQAGYVLPTEQILPLAQDENAQVRVWAVRALGLVINNPEVESVVVKAVDDEDIYVKKAARRALNKL